MLQQQTLDYVLAGIRLRQSGVAAMEVMARDHVWQVTTKFQVAGNLVDTDASATLITLTPESVI